MIVTVTVALTLLLTPSAMLAHAQSVDLDCGNFTSQADAQRVLEQNPSDPNRLDADSDGVACGSKPRPSSTQIAAYVAVSLLTALAIGFTFLYWRRHFHRRSRREHEDVQNKLDRLQESLQSVRTALLEIDEAVDSEQVVIRRLQDNANRAKELSSLTNVEVEAVKSALQDELSVFDKSTFRVTIISSLATSVFGVASSILINILVP